MKTLKITLTNNTNKLQKFNLFDTNFNYLAVRNGIPEGVDIKVETDAGAIEYLILLCMIQCQPYAVSITSSTSNRQLAFETRGFFHGTKPMVPQLTIDGKPLTKKSKWYKNQWNIADTHELFILDFKPVIIVQLIPKQTFELNIAVKTNIKVGQHVLVDFLNTKQ